jgi:hypothetical protein
LELSLSPALADTLPLISNRTLPFAITKAIMPPARRKPGPSPTVKTPCPTLDSLHSKFAALKRFPLNNLIQNRSERIFSEDADVKRAAGIRLRPVDEFGKVQQKGGFDLVFERGRGLGSAGEKANRKREHRQTQSRFRPGR